MTGGTIAIVLIIVGLAVLAYSYYYDRKSEGNEEKNKNIPIDAMKEDELIKFSNEKLAAINEYYVYVIEEIEKKHKELLFLYHMISEKDQDIQKRSKQIELKMNELFIQKEKEVNEVRMNYELKSGVQNTSQAAEFYNTRAQEQARVSDSGEQKRGITVGEEQISKITTSGEQISEITARREQINIRSTNDGVEQTSPVTTNSRRSKKTSNCSKGQELLNNNDLILDLYRQGCTVSEIATKLGIGIGETKLVIDLFGEVIS